MKPRSGNQCFPKRWNGSKPKAGNQTHIIHHCVFNFFPGRPVQLRISNILYTLDKTISIIVTVFQY